MTLSEPRNRPDPNTDQIRRFNATSPGLEPVNVHNTLAPDRRFPSFPAAHATGRSNSLNSLNCEQHITAVALPTGLS